MAAIDGSQESIFSRRIRPLVGALFATGLFTLLDYATYLTLGHSFISAATRGSHLPCVVFVAGCVIGMAWEYLGQVATRSWHYPDIVKHPLLSFVLPIFWGLFMLIMQDGYALGRAGGLNTFWAALLSAVVLGLLIEGVNLYTRSWVYMGHFSAPLYLIAGWVVALTYTFIWGFNAYILNFYRL